MRIVLVLGHSAGGIGTHVAQLASVLRRSGQQVRVVAPADTAARFDLGAVLTCWPSLRPARHVVTGLRAAARARRLLAASDVVHAHGHQAGLVAALLSMTVGRAPRLVVSWHNAVLAGSGRLGAKQVARRFVARRADLVTGASRDLVEEAIALGARAAVLAPVPSPRVPGLLAQPVAGRAARGEAAAVLLAEAGVAARPGLPLVLTISRVAPQKNLPVLLSAASGLGVECTWVVIGDGEAGLQRALRAQAAAAGTPVHLLGRRTDVDRWLRAAEVFVLPSRWEARALVVQEALAAGAPVVASDVGGLHDLLQGCGLLVPVDDVAALAAAVRRVLLDPVLRGELAARGRHAAAVLPGTHDLAKEWLARYTADPPMT